MQTTTQHYDLEEEDLLTEVAQPLEELQGLTEEEAIARRARGEGNNVTITTGRTYIDILRYNVFTFITSILFLIGFIMVVMN